MRLVFSGAFFVGGLVLMACSNSNASSSAPEGGAGGAPDAGPSRNGGAAGSSGAGGTSGTSGAGGASRGGSDASTGAPDAGAGTPDGGEDAGSSDAGSPTKSGFIGLTSQATAVATVFANSLFAGFQDGPGSSFPKGCERQVVGECQTLLCDYADGGAQVPPAGAPESAGKVTVGGTTPTFSLDYDASSKQYTAVPAVPTNQLLFAGGATIQLAAAGADVPAFADSLIAPTPIAVMAPVLTAGALSIDTAKDLAFVWTGTSVGKLAFNIRTTTVNAATPIATSFVSCQFDASALKGTISAALLGKLDKTGAATTAILGTDLSYAKQLVVGDYSIHLAVGSLATQADGKTPYKTTQVTIL